MAIPQPRDLTQERRAERKAVRSHREESAALSAYLTQKYGDNWLETLRAQTKTTVATGQAPTPNGATYEGDPLAGRLTPQQWDAVHAEQQRRFDDMQTDDSIANVYEGLMGAVRTGLSVAESGYQVVSNTVIDAVQPAFEVVTNPGDFTPGQAAAAIGQGVMANMNPVSMVAMSDVPESISNTTLAQQVKIANEDGFFAGFGKEGTGGGYTIPENTRVGKAKQEAAFKQHPMMVDGQPMAASLGRLTAAAVHVRPGTAPWKVISGAVDAGSNLVLDPTNLIGSGAFKGNKAAAALAVLAKHNIDPGDLTDAAKLTVKLSQVGDDSPEILEALHTLRFSLKNQTDNPDLVDNLWDDYDAYKERAAAAAKENDFAADNASQVDDFRDKAKTADDTARQADEALDNAMRVAAEAASENPEAPVKWTQGVIDGVPPERVSKPKDGNAGDVASETNPVWKYETDDLNRLEQEYVTHLREAYGLSQKRAEAMLDYQKASDDLATRWKQHGYDGDEIRNGSVFEQRRAMLGVSNKGVDLSKALAGLARGDFDRFATLVSRIDDPVEMYDLLPDLSVSMARNLSGLKDVEQIKMVMLSEALFGELKDAGNTISLMTRSLGVPGSHSNNLVKRVARVLKTNVPSTMTNANLADDMVKATDNFLLSVGGLVYRTRDFDKWEAWRSGWLRQMMDAPTAEARKRVALEMQADSLRQFEGYNELIDSARIDVLKKLDILAADKGLSEARANFLRAQMSTLDLTSRIAGLADDPATLSDEVAGMINTAADLNDNVAFMSPDAIRRLNDLADTAGNMKPQDWAKTKGRQVNDLYDKYLRPMYLISGGYLALQLMDDSARGILAGHTTLLGSPLQAMALVARRNLKPDNRLNKMLDRFYYPMLDAEGKTLMGEADLTVARTITEQMDDTDIARYLLSNDYHNMNTLGATGGRQSMIDNGWKEVKRGDSGYYSGWSEEVFRRMINDKDGDPIFRDVAHVLSEGTASPTIEKWAAANGYESLPPQWKVTRFYFNGPGKKTVQRLDDAARKGTKTDTQNPLQTAMSNSNKMHEFLWDADDSVSMFNTVNYLTGGDTDILKVVRSVGDARGQVYTVLQRISKNPVKTRLAEAGKLKDTKVRVYAGNGEYKEVNAMNRAELIDVVQQAVKTLPEDRSPGVVLKRDTVSAGDDTNVISQLHDGFFQFTSHFQKNYIQMPIYRDIYLLELAHRLPFMNKADRAVAIKNIERQIPQFKKSRTQREVTSLLRSFRDAPDTKGTYTLKDANEASHKAAFKEFSSLLYGAKGRNAASRRFVLLMPFVQAWGNATRVYMRESYRNPDRVYKALYAYQNLQNEGTDPRQPTRPLFWTDPMTGRQQVTIFGRNVSYNKWNPYNFGEPLPGLGFPITGTAKMFDSIVAPIPQEIRGWLLGPVGADATNDPNAIEALSPRIVKFLDSLFFGGGVGTMDREIEAQAGAALVTVLSDNPDLVAEGGFIKEAGANQIIRDSRGAAVALARGKIVASLINRGGTSDIKTIRAFDGTDVALAVVRQQFDAAVDNAGGDYGAGYAFLHDRYGIEGIAALVGTTETVPFGTEKAYEFSRANPEVFDATADVIGFYMPSVDIEGNVDIRNSSLAFKRLLSQQEKTQTLPAEEYISKVNYALKRMQVYKNEQNLLSGKINEAQYKARDAEISRNFQTAVKGGNETGAENEFMDQIRTAQQNPELAATPVGKALGSWLTKYDQMKAVSVGGSLGGKDDASRRAYLQQEGEYLSQVVPEFSYIWRTKLQWMVQEDG